LKLRSDATEGIALVAVLAFIVLLSILVVAYISYARLNNLSTTSYSREIQAQELAQGGLQDILDDLHQEIVAGSIPDPTGTTYSQKDPVTQNTTTIYVPYSNLSAMPARLGYVNSGAGNKWSYGTATAPTTAPATLLPTLVRVSRADPAGLTALYPPLNPAAYPNLSSLHGSSILNRASKVSTGMASIDGRYISAARWNKPYLLASSTKLIPTPFYNSEALPLAAYPGVPDLPDWVYVTRTGSRVCADTEIKSSLLLSSSSPSTPYPASPSGSNPSASPIVGRYAFVIYDEGALLDANVAGSPSTLVNNTTPSTVSVVATPTSVPIFTGGSSSNIPTSLSFSGKSYLASADLSQLPGLTPGVTGAQTGLTAQKAIDNFLNWRSAGAINGVTSGGNAFLGAIFNYAMNGFLTFVPGDSPLLNRQDLINYFANIDPPNAANTIGFNTQSPSFSNALPYLGTFSRALSAPSWTPQADSNNIPGWIGGKGTLIITYKANAENPNNLSGSIANRDLANVRFAAAGTVTHYFDDQASATLTATYTVKIGDPLLQNRFSLARIDWLSQVSPQPSDGKTSLPSNYATAIQACFGLTWGTFGQANGGNPCWGYVGSPAGAGATVAPFNGTIETLDQVAQEAREPNFFEFLKAAILSGSLGQNPGQCVKLNGSYTPYDLHNGPNDTGVDGRYAYSYDTAATIPSPYQMGDMQIMQIGANIIDQYDSDSYPTAIYFKYKFPTSSAQLGNTAGGVSLDQTSSIFGPTDTVYGDENLPELTGFFNPCCTVDGQPPVDTTDKSPTQMGTYGPTQGLSMWWQPEIWNPHAEPNPLNGGSEPTSMTYVIQGFGQAGFEWIGDTAKNPPSGSSVPQTFDNQTITFVDSSPATSAFYAQPLLLTQNGTVAGVSVTASDPTDMMANSSMEGWSGTITNGNGTYSVNPNHFVGFWCGNDPTYPGSKVDVNVTTPSNNSVISFSLGWKDSAGKVHPYSFMPGVFAYIYGVVNNNSAIGGTPAGFTDPLQISASWHALIDPRTQRFSGMCSWTSGWQFSTANTTFFTDPTHRFLGSENGTPWVLPTASNFVYDPTPTKTYPNQDGYNEEDWEANSPTPTPPTDSTYYLDPDGVVRPADGCYGNAGNGNGMPLFTVAGSSNSPIGDNTVSQHGRRPIILNRSFRSVGELGYVFRDLPFKTLDFFSPSSADAALLDVFSLTDESKFSNSQISTVVAGQVNLSNAPLPVLQAVLAGGSKKDLDPTYYIGDEPTASPTVLAKLATNIATNLNSTSGPNPLLNRSSLVTQLNTLQLGAASPYWGVIQSTRTVFGMPAIIGSFNSPSDQSNKAYLESPIRAMADVANTRTWNLLIDIIAQSGQLSSTAQTLGNFVVQGEKRYWLHVAIDRYSGKIVAEQLEPVYE
jgi:hypothetical protein